MKEFRFIGLVFGLCVGTLLMANSQFPEPLHTFTYNTHLTSHIPERFLDFGQAISDAEHLSIEGRDIPIRVPAGKIVTERELEVVKEIIRNDFLVNDDTTGGCLQFYPSVALDSAGNFVVCWLDRRNVDADIYAQRYDALGIPIGANFRVNDNVGTNDNYGPSVVMDNAGNFVVCWEDERNGDNDIYAQRYDALGIPQGANFQVNDDVGTTDQYNPSVALDNAGNFVVCWQDKRNVNYDIYAQRYDASGIPQGANFLVNDDAGTSHQYSPSVAPDNAGNFVVCWHDKRNGDNDIYAQRYDASGIPQGANFRVNDDVGTSIQQSSSVALDDAGNFVVCWQDKRNGDYDIYAQRYDASGIPQGANFLVNDDVGAVHQYNPSVALDNAGNFVVCWEDKRNGDNDIYAQQYDASGIPQGANFRVNDDVGTTAQYGPSVAMDNAGNFVVCWWDMMVDDGNIYAQRYDASGNPQGANFLVNDDVGSTDQYYPSVALDDAGNFVVCWQDSRNGDNDIYAQRYDASGIPQGANFLVNDDVGTSLQDYPSVALDNAGNFVVCWQDKRNGNHDIYAQQYDASGIPQGANFLVNDDAGTSHQYSPSVALDNAGNFVVCWGDRRNVNRDIYAQQYDASGIPHGANFRVNDDVGTDAQYYPSVAMNDAGYFVVCWWDMRNGIDIYAQRYDAPGHPQGVNFLVNDDVGTGAQYYPSVALDNAGNFVVCWEDARNGDYDTYAQRYDASGIPQGANFRVNDDVGTTDQLLPSVAIDPSGGRFVIVWTDFRNPDGDPELVAQKYENGQPVGLNVQINEPDLFPYNRQESATFCLACNHNTLGFTWRDNRRHKGWDIYGKLIDWVIWDIACLSVVSPPADTIAPGYYDVIGEVHNFGVDVATFYVTANVYDTIDAWTMIFAETITITDFPSGADSTVNFGIVGLVSDKVFYTEIFTVYVGDENSANDTASVYSNTFSTGVEEQPSSDKPLVFGFAPGMPNPIKEQVAVSYTTTVQGKVSLKIYDSAGRLIRTLIEADEPAGAKTVCWNGKDCNNRAVPSGVYFFRLEAENKLVTHKVILVR